VVEELLVSLDGQAVALCTHGDVVGPLISMLRLRGVDVGDAPVWEKGSTWLLAVAGQRISSATYLPPPA
jgi:hypothetical protein